MSVESVAQAINAVYFPLMEGFDGAAIVAARAAIAAQAEDYADLLVAAKRVALVMRDRAHAGDIFKICFEDLQATIDKAEQA